MRAKIEELSDGQLVFGNGEYSRVKTCVHGNAFYGYIGTEADAEQAGYTVEDITAAVEVSDIDTDHVGHCCG